MVLIFRVGIVQLSQNFQLLQSSFMPKTKTNRKFERKLIQDYFWFSGYNLHLSHIKEKDESGRGFEGAIKKFQCLNQFCYKPTESIDC